MRKQGGSSNEFRKTREHGRKGLGFLTAGSHNILGGASKVEFKLKELKNSLKQMKEQW